MNSRRRIGDGRLKPLPKRRKAPLRTLNAFSILNVYCALSPRRRTSRFRGCDFNRPTHPRHLPDAKPIPNEAGFRAEHRSGVAGKKSNFSRRQCCVSTGYNMEVIPEIRLSNFQPIPLPARPLLRVGLESGTTRRKTGAELRRKVRAAPALRCICRFYFPIAGVSTPVGRAAFRYLSCKTERDA